MRKSGFIRRSIPLSLSVILAAVAATGGIAALINHSTRSPHAATLAYPSSMAALGDSISRGANSCGKVADCPPESWSAGTDPAVNSIAQRLQAHDPSTPVSVYNDAQSGSRVSALPAKASTVVAQKAELVAILMGSNDSCRPTEADMTSVASFRISAQQTIDTLTSGLPDARILVVGQPDTYNLWLAGKNSPSAITVWNAANICQSMLANPTSDLVADNDRRARVEQRIKDYNATWADICSNDHMCHYTDAVANYKFVISDISNLDYFHPSIQGQGVIAQLAWTDPTTWSDGPIPSPAPVDVNHDGKVNVTDLSLLLSHWGTNYPDADFNNDGTVSVVDLSLLLSNWAP